MKKILLLLVLISLTSFKNKELNTDDIIGEVIWEKNHCDFYIVETKSYFVLVEWYQGNINNGDKLKGELHSYSFKYLINMSRNNEKIKVYIENYWSTKKECFDWLRKNNKCGFENED